MMTTGLDWPTIVTTVISDICARLQWSDYQIVDVCGRSCKVQIRGRFHKLNELVYDGRCECGGITGSARHYSNRKEAAQNAIEDFVFKAEKAGLIKSGQIHQ